MRDDLKIDISGSREKLDLRNFGYYHTIKGYRFVKQRANKINYSTFSEISKIYSFDQELKHLLYPQIMFIETAIKNRVLEELLRVSKNASFSHIYEMHLNNYKNYAVGSKNHTKAVNKKLGLRNKIYSNLSYQYSKKHKIPQHFYNKDENVPIWAIFELISMGELGNLMSTMNAKIKTNVGKSLKINTSFNSNGKIAEDVVFLLKDLRNSIAHNNVIFDNRFHSLDVSKQLTKCLQHETSINNINFKSIVDYFILIIYIQKQLGVSKTTLKAYVTDFETAINKLRNSIPIKIFNKFIFTNTKNKLLILSNFIKV